MAQIYNMTEHVARIRTMFDKQLDAKLDHIAELSGVDRSQLIKINPADFIERNPYQQIDGYVYRSIAQFIETQKRDDTYLINLLNDDERTSDQISYKQHQSTVTIRANKCDAIALPIQVANEFYSVNHRQGACGPLIKNAVSFGLVFRGVLVACMTYGQTGGAIRGRKKQNKFELVRLSIRQSTRVNGGASKLQKHCERALAAEGVTELFSYSNATINTGNVYRALGFENTGLDVGRVYVIEPNGDLLSLANISSGANKNRESPAKNAPLARAGRLKARLSGNKLWTKSIFMS